MASDIKNKMLTIINNVKFFRDSSNEYYAKYSWNNHEEVVKVSSSRFLAYLDKSLRSTTGKPLVRNWSNLILMKKQDCELSNVITEVYSRIANNDEKIVYFLADDDWRYVEVTKNSCNIVNSSEFLFIKKANMSEQAEPKFNDTTDRLRKYVNLQDDSYLLFKINLIQEFFIKSSHFASVISSPFGSGKSTFTKIWRAIIDPANAEVSILSNNPEDFKVQLANNIVITLDNTRKLKNEFSDLICGAVTGTSFSKRTLYTNSEETILKLKNIFIVNGIDAVPRNQDLISRSLLFELNSIPDNKRISEAEIWKSFKADLPYILGDIFNTLSKALQILETLTLKSSGRMVDATLEMLAIAIAMGISEDEFYKLLKENQQRLAYVCSKHNDFVSAIEDYFETLSRHKIEGKVSDVYSAIKDFKKGDIKYFPKSPSAFSRKIKTEESALLASGIKFFTQEKKDGTYITIIRKKKR